jgi:hypothetical protein
MIAATGGRHLTGSAMVIWFFARAIFVWLYNRTGSSVLLVAIFHASFAGARVAALECRDQRRLLCARLIFSAVIVLVAIALIIATNGQLGRSRKPLTFMPASLMQTHD